MMTWSSRCAMTAFLLLRSASAYAQQPPATTAPQDPPAAVGEATAKPTRSFVPSLLHNLADDVKHIPRRNTLYWLGAGTAAAALVHPEDHDINAELADKSSVFAAGKVIGATPTILGAAAAAYLVGSWTESPRLRHLGLDEIEGAILADVIAEGGKQIARRDRPLNADGSKQAGFSFPSGHATTAFTAATILQQHLGYRAGIPTYLVASYVAISRLHDNRHFASDVAFGAATGIIIGRSVTWHGRNFYGMPVVQDGGVAMTFGVR